MAFDGVDFDEPMEVGLEAEETTAVKDDAEAEPKATKVAAVKVEAKVEPLDPAIM